jgi:membrane associated rhomboid family serine protease
MFNAPPQAMVLTVAIVALYGLQSLMPGDQVAQLFAFYPAGLGYGRWDTLVTALFVHGGWGHALMNAAFALAFGAPVAQFFGPRLPGWLWFFGFYLVCGVLANLGFAAVHPNSMDPLVGASGAVSGLMGAAARMLGGRGRVGRLFSPPVLAMGAALLVINLLVAVLGSIVVPGAGGAAIAWEAHIAGFLAGVLLIGPVARFAERR